MFRKSLIDSSSGSGATWLPGLVSLRRSVFWLGGGAGGLTVVSSGLAGLSSGLLLLHGDHLLVLGLDVAVRDEEVVGFGGLLVEVGGVSEELLDVDGSGFEEHTSDLSGEVTEHSVDGLVNVVSDEVLLLVRLHLGEAVKVDADWWELVDLTLGWLLGHGLDLLRHLMNLLLGLLHIHLLHLLHLGHVHLLLLLLGHLCNLILIILLVSMVHLVVIVLASLWVSSVLEFSGSSVLE